MTIVLATNNKHKILELTSLLSGFGVEWKRAADVPGLPPLVEDGFTFSDNALRKARTVQQHTGGWALADDSGLEVPYLNGRPGVFSARYAGNGATDEENNEKLLREMRGVAPRRRSAQFRAVLALVGPGAPRVEELTEGVCPGVLGEEPLGTNGFGYDPIFRPAGFDRTYAQLTQEEKNRVSHRARAAEAMRPILARLAR